MFLTIFLTSFFSAESLISTVVGGLVAVGATQWLKKGTKLRGAGATLLAFFISVIVAAGAFVLSTVLSGGQISYDLIPQGAAQIFALATLTYNLLVKDNS